ncbi:29488_t:CDS:2 [Gigaspora margarita]|uniref:29488_t:CDS:1 n=1 Tax=Gigaspora margarita TaxID=4874 RepID=A0ABM8VY77_GIGMA|nr:29488_t:CDS:2 [Gigaspora margarita]
MSETKPRKMLKAQNKQKVYHDQKYQIEIYQIGDKVMLYESSHDTSYSSKLEPSFTEAHSWKLVEKIHPCPLRLRALILINTLIIDLARLQPTSMAFTTKTLEVNAKFLDHVMILRRMIKNTNVVEVRITTTEIDFISSQGEPACLKFSEDITTNPSTRALDSYLSDLRCTDISTRLPEPAPEGTWREKLDTICNEILTGEHDSVSLLQSTKRNETLKIVNRVFQLYRVRGLFNLLENKSITARALYRMNKKDFQLLVEKAQIVREEELAKFLRDPSQELRI